MTREEAIDILLNTGFFGRSMDDIDGAIDMAVEALKADAKLVRFAEWVADWVLRSDFEENAGGFAELACRRLEALGIMRKEGHYWVRNEVESHEID